MPGPARGFHADSDVTWHLNRALGGRHRDPPPPPSSWAEGLAPACSVSGGPPASLAPRAHHRRSPLPPAPPLQPQSPPSKPLQPPAGRARTAPRTRRAALPPALVFKCARRSHWPVWGGARQRSTGPRPQSCPTRGSGSPRLAAPGCKFEQRPLIGEERAAAPPSRPGLGVLGELSPGSYAGASLVANGQGGLGLLWACSSQLLRRQKSRPPEATERRGLSVKVCAYWPRLSAEGVAQLGTCGLSGA